MASDEHLAILQQGVEVWNTWRSKHGDIRPDLRRASLVGADLYEACLAGADLYEASLSEATLRRADLVGANLYGASLRGANLRRGNLSGAHLDGADLRGADLRRVDFGGASLRSASVIEANLIGASLSGADLSGADFSNASLTGADLVGANLSGTNLRGANLAKADLMRAHLVNTCLVNANLTNCRVYGISAWDLLLDGSRQVGLIITGPGQAIVTIDDLEMAQFIYQLLRNERVRYVIDTITSKVVLVLGRFTQERKAALDTLREELRKRDYLPVLFDFDKVSSQTLDETVSLLWRMSRFVVADITDAKSVLQELRGNVPELPSVPVQPLILASQTEPGMFDFFKRFPWVLSTFGYDSAEQLVAHLDARVIGPAEAKARELRASP